jgi:3-oxoacyl-[acyl-carrier-protein] synthase-3
VQYHLPTGRRSNDDLGRLNASWSAADIYRKTGIRARPVAADGETTSDLAVQAAEKLLSELAFDRRRVDALLFCTQTADYYLPTTACIIQDRLGLPTSCAAFDFNLGCSGFTYGLWLARSLIQSGSAAKVLLLAGDTLSKYCSPNDQVTATIFGDGAGAALISDDAAGALATVGESVCGADGRGAPNLIIRAGGARMPRCAATAVARRDDYGNERSDDQVSMNGTEVFNFTLTAVEAGIRRLLEKIGVDWEDVDFFLLHQANAFILETLRKRMKLPREKLPIDLEETGNTSSASLPVLLRRLLDQGRLRPGARCVLAGFGVGYSWAMTYLTVNGAIAPDFRVAPAG